MSLLGLSCCLRTPFCRQTRTLTRWRNAYRIRCVRHAILRCTGSIFPRHSGFCPCPAIVCKDLSAPGNTRSTRPERPGVFMMCGLSVGNSPRFFGGFRHMSGSPETHTFGVCGHDCASRCPATRSPKGPKNRGELHMD